MKKIQLLAILFILFTAGCAKNNNDAIEIAYEDKLKEYGVNYYETYEFPFHEGEFQETYEVSVFALKSAVENADSTYDLSGFDTCTNDTKVILQLDEKGNVTGYDYFLNCGLE
jgi:hypothetical protein